MRQVVYISTAARSIAPGDMDAILDASRRNNARDAISGLLYYDGRRFLQVLEGQSGAVARALGRIEGDARHRAIVVLSDRIVEAREFGDWAMAAQRPGGDFDSVVARVDALCVNAAPGVRATFVGFAETRRDDLRLSVSAG
ncbi:BLUF domain-containing protein [Sphingomonas sp. RS2018]